MTKLIEVASRAQDLFYQDYADRDRFFDVNDFKFHFATIYSAMLNDLMQKIRIRNKQEEGFSNVEVSPGWLIEDENLPVQISKDNKTFFVLTTYPVFTFDFDPYGNGLNGIKQSEENCEEGIDYDFVKLTINEFKFLKVAPVTDKTYYCTAATKKGRTCINMTKNPTKVNLYYVPSVVGNDDNCVLADTMVAPALKETMTLMFGAKNGNVVQEANDGNKNLVMGQQVNPSLTQVQKNM